MYYEGLRKRMGKGRSGAKVPNQGGAEEGEEGEGWGSL